MSASSNAVDLISNERSKEGRFSELGKVAREREVPSRAQEKFGFSVDKKTRTILKDRFLELIKSQVKTIETSPEEELVAIGVDLFRVLK